MVNVYDAANALVTLTPQQLIAALYAEPYDRTERAVMVRQGIVVEMDRADALVVIYWR